MQKLQRPKVKRCNPCFIRSFNNGKHKSQQMTGYEEYYKTEDLFGEPYQELKTFFSQYPVRGKLLDLGCGQGRDAIAMARLGYSVTAIDTSGLGIRQMLDKAKKEQLDITGIVEDIYQFDDYKSFDFVLLDSMFHFEKRDLEKETDLLKKIACEIKNQTVLCVCIQDTGKKVSILKDTIDNSGIEYKVLNDTALIYTYEDKASGHKTEMKYCMYIVQKK